MRHLPQGHWPGFGEPRKSTVFLGPRTQLTDFSQISAHASGAWRHYYPWSHPLSGIFIVTSLNDPSALHAREHLRPCLHLTNPCAKRKVLSLSKPKGKIYKTKSLGHYITVGYFLLIITRSGLQAGVRWFACISKSQRILCVSFSWTDSGLCMYHIILPTPRSGRIWHKVNF